MDVTSVHHNSTLLRYSVSLLGYGFYGDLIKDSEKKRWMGLVRYDFSGNSGQAPWQMRCEHSPGMLPLQTLSTKHPLKVGAPRYRQDTKGLALLQWVSGEPGLGPGLLWPTWTQHR
jgi:hypothetical protein